MPVEVNAENKASCLCPTCPTYDACMRAAGEVLYCGVGKSGCDVGAAGCLCPGCPVHKRYALKSTYFCISGAAS